MKSDTCFHFQSHPWSPEKYHTAGRHDTVEARRVKGCLQDIAVRHSPASEPVHVRACPRQSLSMSEPVYVRVGRRQSWSTSEPVHIRAGPRQSWSTSEPVHVRTSSRQSWSTSEPVHIRAGPRQSWSTSELVPMASPSLDKASPLRTSELFHFRPDHMYPQTVVLPPQRDSSPHLTLIILGRRARE